MAYISNLNLTKHLFLFKILSKQQRQKKPGLNYFKEKRLFRAHYKCHCNIWSLGIIKYHTWLQYILLFYSKVFNRFENMDCTGGMHFHTLHSNDHPNYGNCKTWCNNNNNCKAFTVYWNTCFFKSGDCQNRFSGLSGATTFILQGETKEIKA